MLSLRGTKPEKPFSLASSPHLHAAHSAQTIVWGMIASLLPIGIASIFFFKWNALRILFVVLSSAIAFECLFRILTKRQLYIQNGSAILTGVLFAFLLPPTLSWQLILLGTLLAVVMGKEIFGGFGQNLLHPSLFGYGVLVLFSPEVMVGAQLLGGASLVAIVISGMILVVKKWISWEASFLYIAAVAIGSSLLGRDVLREILNGSILIGAFFFVTDWTTTPVTKEGRALFAVGAGILTAIIHAWIGSTEAMATSILLMNALAPTLDRFAGLHLRKVFN